MSRPLRVLCVTPSGVEGRGGIDRLYLYLRDRGRPDALAGIEVRYAATRGPAEGLGWVLALPRHYLALVAALMRFRPHVVHVNFAGGASAWRKLAVVGLARLAGARVAVHLHDPVPERALREGSLRGRLFTAICAGADRVIVLGEPSARLLRALGQPADKLRVLLNGIPDFAADIALPKGNDPVHILFAGHVGERKGAGVLLDALALLAERAEGWHCTLAGNGEVAAHEARARALNLGGRVRFTGWLDAEAMHGLMREADIVVLPSRAEALPLSLIEGACAGAALVATDVSNTVEVLHEGVNGRLVTREPESIAAALHALVSDRERLARMQVASRILYTERMTLDAFADGLTAIYRDLGRENPESVGIRPATAPPEPRDSAGRPGGSF